MDDQRGRLTAGWKAAIVVALLGALGNTGINSLRDREEQRHRNHERRIDSLESKIRKLESELRLLKPKAAGVGE
ncbi:MAG: hypothetical protein SFX72_08090 [Isosphaeraceae bacterium]|nr:hypothetical protein [Isosphaeraceae bacterium]